MNKPYRYFPIKILLGLFAGLLVHACQSLKLQDKADTIQGTSRAQLVFVVGDNLYQTHKSLEHFAASVEDVLPVRAQVWNLSRPSSQGLSPHVVLSEADLVVFGLGGLTLPPETFQELQHYLESGRPALCIQPSQTSFIYPQTHPLHKWNQEFAIQYFGAGHRKMERYGPGASVSVLPEAQGQPILQGLSPTFWTYTIPTRIQALSAYATPLLMSEPKTGALEGGECFMEGQLSAWTYLNPQNSSRRFFTTLGAPQDFEDPDFRKLIANAMYWALGWELEIPEGGWQVPWTKESF